MTAEIWYIGRAAFVIRTPDDKVWIYEGGSEASARHKLLPFLVRHLGVSKLEGAFIGHFHFDHSYGFGHHLPQRLAMSYYSSGVYSGPNHQFSDEDEAVRQAIAAAIDDNDISHTYLRAGDTVGDWWTAMGPTQAAVDANAFLHDGRLVTNNPNDNTGLPMLLQHGSFSMLFSSDFGPSRDNENPLAGWYEMKDGTLGSLMDCTIFQVAHHGDIRYIKGPDGSEDDIINAVSPDLAIVGNRATASDADEVIPWLDARNIPWAWLWTDAPMKITGYDDGTFDLLTNGPTSWFPISRGPGVGVGFGLGV